MLLFEINIQNCNINTEVVTGTGMDKGRNGYATERQQKLYEKMNLKRFAFEIKVRCMSMKVQLVVKDLGHEHR